MRAGSASVMLEGIAGSGEAARQAGGTGRCALLTGSVAAPAARLLVRSEVLALKSAHSRGCVRAVLFRGGALCVAVPRRVDRRSSPEVARSGRSVFMMCGSGWVRGAPVIIYYASERRLNVQAGLRCVPLPVRTAVLEVRQPSSTSMQTGVCN